ncbi:MAG: indole-3-glycerol phosphate synthase TrpC [Candidatus Hydrogenedens sp.]
MILDEIVRNKKIEIQDRKREISIVSLYEKIKSTEKPRCFISALMHTGPTLIAEIKRHSPSRGPIWEDLNPSELSFRYQTAGASAISVLTDAKYFHGSLQDLTEAHHTVQIPCLRKEFIIDEYQIYETRVHHADTLLLIVRILSDMQLKDFLSLTRELEMEPLVEVHNENEVERAIDAGAKIIGINNRDLDTLEVDIETTLRLKKNIPEDYIVVSESGISHPQTIQKFYEHGVQSFLIGESILYSRKPEDFIQWLLGKGKYEG